MKPVLIVGAGPTGMTAALEFARLGVPVRLVEKTPAPATTSRAIGVQARTLELFEPRGLTPEMVSLGNPATAVSVYGGGQRVFHLDFAHVDTRYQYVLFLSQAETERILREKLAQAGVTIERPVEMIAFAQKESAAHPKAGSVSATLRRTDGSLEEVEASCLIACEGAHSTVRSTLGLPFAGKTRDENYALGDLYLDGDLPGSDLHIFSSEHGFMGLFPMGKGHFRLIASHPLSEPGQGTAPSLEELQKIYDERSHIPARFHDLTWSSWFRINSRMVDRLRHGSVFFGGDSAHIHSPAGAQGMNTGIQDMINLAWKLAFVLRGQATPALLDTYADDRLPVIRGVLRQTDTLTDAIGSESAVFRTLFEHVAPLVVGTETVQEIGATRVSQVGLNYRGSPLSETHGHYHGTVHGGDRLPPHLLVVSGGQAKTLSEWLDPSRFTLLVANAAGIDQARVEEVAGNLASWNDLLTHRRIDPAEDEQARKRFADVFGTAPALVLARPDGYAGYVGPVAESGKLLGYLKRWLTPPDGDYAA